LDYAAAFPGILFSTVLIGMITIFIPVFAICTVLSTRTFYTQLWGYRAVLIGLFMPILMSQILKRLVLDRWCVEDGEISRPRLFALIYMVLVVINFASGLLVAVSRLAFMLPFLFLKFYHLDETALSEGAVIWDAGYSAFLSLVINNYREMNPIRRGFISKLAPEMHRLHGQTPSETPQRSSRRLWRKTPLSRIWTCTRTLSGRRVRSAWRSPWRQILF